LAALGVWLAPAPTIAQARWLRAETQRFVVYSDGDKAELEGFARKLSSFDMMLRLRHKVEERDVRRKLEVNLVRGPLQLRRVQPRVGYGVGGFYRATPSQIMAVAIRDEDGLGADDILFHEYTHHFMLEYFPVAYPAWLIEGYAEYFGTAQITPAEAIAVLTPLANSPHDETRRERAAALIAAVKGEAERPEPVGADDEDEGG
jgi:hypothetical protein